MNGNDNEAAAAPEAVVTYCGRRLTPKGTRECWGYLSYGVEDLPRGTKLYAAPGAAAPVGDDGKPMVLVSQEFKAQAEYDAEICSAASNILRSNSLGLSGSLPGMVGELLKLASTPAAPEVGDSYVVLQRVDVKRLLAGDENSPGYELSRRRIAACLNP